MSRRVVTRESWRFPRRQLQEVEHALIHRGGVTVERVRLQDQELLAREHVEPRAQLGGVVSSEGIRVVSMGEALVAIVGLDSFDLTREALVLAIERLREGRAVLSADTAVVQIVRVGAIDRVTQDDDHLDLRDRAVDAARHLRVREVIRARLAGDRAVPAPQSPREQRERGWEVSAVETSPAPPLDVEEVNLLDARGHNRRMQL